MRYDRAEKRCSYVRNFYRRIDNFKTCFVPSNESVILACEKNITRQNNARKISEGQCDGLEIFHRQNTFLAKR